MFAIIEYDLKPYFSGGKMKVKVFTVLTLAVALFLSACGKSDADLLKAANDKLAADKVTGVTVAVKDGVATLTGEVADVTVKTKAATSVKAVDGIKSVTDSTTTKPLPTPPPVSPDKMIQGLLEEKLKKAGIDGVTVAVADGEITLSGKVDKAKFSEIMMLANESKPKKIINNLNK